MWHTFVACNGWITEIAWDAFTDTPVVFGQAKSIQSTAHKWTCRNTITLWTFLVKLAIKVRFTLRLGIHYKREITFSMHLGLSTNKRPIYHFHMCHHSQLRFLQDKYMLHSWLKLESQWQYTVETLSKDCWQDKGSGKFHACKSIWVDNPCQLGIRVPLFQLLE